MAGERERNGAAEEDKKRRGEERGEEGGKGEREESRGRVVSRGPSDQIISQPAGGGVYLLCQTAPQNKSSSGDGESGVARP
jgi:hypothetical protein